MKADSFNLGIQKCHRDIDGYQYKMLAVIPAAGIGVRMGMSKPKQFLEISSTPILAFSLIVLNSCDLVSEIIISTTSSEISLCQKSIVERYNLDKVTKVVKGGERRQDSVRYGLEAAEGNYDFVLIHDAVRPFLTNGLIESVFKAALKTGAATAAVPAKETVKMVTKEGFVKETLDRKSLRLIQTPQIFSFETIFDAHQTALSNGWDDVTDDAEMIERLGHPVEIVAGDERNIKITTPYDLRLASFFAQYD